MVNTMLLSQRITLDLRKRIKRGKEDDDTVDVPLFAVIICLVLCVLFMVGVFVLFSRNHPYLPTFWRVTLGLFVALFFSDLYVFIFILMMAYAGLTGRSGKNGLFPTLNLSVEDAKKLKSKD